MKAEGEALRREFSVVATGRGQKFPEGLRRRGGSFAMAQRRAGRSFAWIAQMLGVSEQTVRRWVRDGVGKASFVPVEVAEDDERAETVCSRVVVSPKGYRACGLSLDEVARLLQELG